MDFHATEFNFLLNGAAIIENFFDISTHIHIC